jgi:hypothetical protein
VLGDSGGDAEKEERKISPPLSATALPYRCVHVDHVNHGGNRFIGPSSIRAADGAVGSGELAV